MEQTSFFRNTSASDYDLIKSSPSLKSKFLRMKLITFTILSLLWITWSCEPAKRVQRLDTAQQNDLSGRWNDTDSRLAAEELTTQILGEKWLPRYEQNHTGKRPAVVVGLIKNKSHEHIDAETFIKDMERAIINNGSVRLVQAGEKRDELRGERDDQQKNASLNTMKKWGLELGADFILQGTINSIVDEYGNQKVVYYQINLELTDLESNEIVWVGEKKIKKGINN
jgi:penicillin-binding protein activator